jgi:hypothetical protein
MQPLSLLLLWNRIPVPGIYQNPYRKSILFHHPQITPSAQVDGRIGPTKINHAGPADYRSGPAYQTAPLLKFSAIPF